MTDQGASYAPRSPDLSGYQLEEPQLMTQSPSFFPHQTHSRQNVHPQQAPTSNPVLSPYQSTHRSQSPGNFSPNPATRHSRTDTEMDDEWVAEVKPQRGRRSKKQKVEVDYGTKPAPGVEEGIEVKTKFPVARIKRIMQADEDVGKVAQVTPTAVSKALELFMISLVTKAANQAKAKSAKKVTAAHLKQAVLSDEQFDFLTDIMAKVPDAPASKKEEDIEGLGDGKKPRGAPRRKKTKTEEI